MNFKSERAAKMAFTKAEKAWDEQRSLENKLTWECRDKMRANGGSMASAEYEDYQRRIEAAKQAQPALFEKMREIYNAATEQKFYVKSWHFGVNPTRDLIAANMD